MAKKNLYGANEATVVANASTSLDTVPTGRLTFGKGQFDEAQVIGITTKDDSDEKVRFVYEAEGHSGLVFVGNKLASSKILDITTNETKKVTYDPTTGALVEDTVEKVADKVTVKWFGKGMHWEAGKQVEDTDYALHTTEFDIIDKATVEALIAASKAELQKEIDDLEEQHAEDTSRLDASVSSLEDFVASDIITEAENGAITVTPDNATKQTYTVGVNVDGTTVKVVSDKIAVGTYAIDKLDSSDGSAEYDSNYASQYRLTYTDPETGEVTQVGETINIMKDFLLKGAHVCEFKYAQADLTKELDYSEGADQWGYTIHVNYGDPIVEGQLPWACYTNGAGELVWEQADFDYKPVLKYGHTYLHLVLNTKDDDEKTDGTSGNDQATDVYLDFTEILGVIKSGDKYIDIENGKFTLKIDEVTKYVDASLGITSEFAAINSSLNDHESRIAEAEEEIVDLNAVAEHVKTVVDPSISNIEASYVKDVTLEAPSAKNDQFNTLKLTTTKEGVESETEIDVANASFYSALNDTITTLAGNDTYLVSLLTWTGLD